MSRFLRLVVGLAAPFALSGSAFYARLDHHPPFAPADTSDLVRIPSSEIESAQVLLGIS